MIKKKINSSTPHFRVAFIITDENWLGGLNYLRTMLAALNSIKCGRINPILFVPTGFSREAEFRGVTIIKTALLERSTFAWVIKTIVKRMLGGRDLILSWALNNHKIQIYSHGFDVLLGFRGKIIRWIPDFQHIYYPEFFPGNQLAQRTRHLQMLLKNSESVVLSSKCAEMDLNVYHKGEYKKSTVVNFIAQLPAECELSTKNQIQSRYDLPESWIHLPNQFWKHKNHIVVIDALKLAKDRNIMCPTVLCTGDTNDVRNPQHFHELTAKIKENGLDDYMRIMGIIPRMDVLSIMYHSKAVLNPSFFEGWSTTVEEAKAFDKKLLLSRIPVHLEQAPLRALYFDPSNPEELFELLKEISEACTPEEHPIDYDKILMRNIADMNSFGKRCESAILNPLIA